MAFDGFYYFSMIFIWLCMAFIRCSPRLKEASMGLHFTDCILVKMLLLGKVADLGRNSGGLGRADDEEFDKTKGQNQKRAMNHKT